MSQEKPLKDEQSEKKVEVWMSDKLWEMIQKLPINIYAVPDQVLGQHVERLRITEDEVHLKLKSAAVLPAMEEALNKVSLDEGKRFDVSLQKSCVVISVVSDSDVLFKAAEKRSKNE